MRDLTGFETGKANCAASDIEIYINGQPDRPKRFQNSVAGSEVPSVFTDHCEILRAVKKESLNLRQYAVKVEAIKRSQAPSDGVSRLDQGKRSAGFENAMQLSCKCQMLLGIEGLEAKGGNRKLCRITWQVGGQHVGTVVGDATFTTFVQPIYGLPVHTGADVYGCDRADTGKPVEQMRPGLSGASHQINARCCGVRWECEPVHTGLAPDSDQSERGDRAPIPVSAGTSVKNVGHKVRIINIIAHDWDGEGMDPGMQGFAYVH